VRLIADLEEAEGAFRAGAGVRAVAARCVRSRRRWEPRRDSYRRL